MSKDNCKTSYEIVQKMVEEGNVELTIDASGCITDVASVPSRYWTKEMAAADAWANTLKDTKKGDAMDAVACIASNAASIGWILNDPIKDIQKNVNNVVTYSEDLVKNTAECNKNYIEYAKVPQTTNCHGTFKFEWGFDEKEKEHKEKMNEAEKENLRKFAIKIEPKRILQNGPVTVVFWGDGTKTLVRRSENSADDPYSAFCAALAKKIYGNNSRVKKILEKKTVKAKAKEKKGEKKDGGNAENPES